MVPVARGAFGVPFVKHPVLAEPLQRRFHQLSDLAGNGLDGRVVRALDDLFQTLVGVP
jgi:hypothetical protein